MPMTMSQFQLQLNDAIGSENGSGLAYLLRPTSPHGKDLVKEFRNPTRASLSRYEGALMSPWDEISIQYVLVCTHVAKERPKEAFKEQSQLVTLFYRYFIANDGWTLQALFGILRDLRDLAFDADLWAKCNDLPSDCTEESARIINKAFGNCLTDRTSAPDHSRKWGVYYIVGLVLKCYFRAKKVSLSKNIIRALHANTDIPPLSLFPRSHQVTYRYYLGMLSFLNEDYAKSEQELTAAFYNCHIQAYKNQERILIYLVPLRVLRGHLPSSELMSRFPVIEEIFAPFIAAIRRGDVAAYDAALESSEHRLVELNIWLTLEKARELCLRGLFRRVWLASGKSSRIPLAMFHSSLRIPGAGSDVSAGEAECLVANMIYKGFMNGYIAHGPQIVVISKVDPFPRLADRQAPLAFV